MLATTTTTIPHNKPIITASHAWFNPTLKYHKIPNTPTSRFHSSGDFVLKRPLFRHKMSGSIEISAFNGGRVGDEDVEALVNDSSLLPPKFNSTVGFESTLNRMSKWIVTALFVGIIVVRHDALALWAAMGSVVNAWLSHALKKIINQERPVSTLKPDPGMPSSHAQSIFFAAVFAVVSLFECFGANGFSIALSGLILAFGSYLTWLRVSQKLHTVSQVLVGAVVGSIFSTLWFWSWNAFVLEAFLSSLWVRILVVVVAVGFCLGFLIYVMRYWIMDRR